ncbi:MAG: hypothetical protein IT298_07000 [Chloroflexi bacterium]|nr:hypothetical protein [Chloroflexota bacterium]
MSKAIIITDFAYKGPKRTGRGTGPKGLKATLKYLQYRDTRNNHLTQHTGYERWQDRGLGIHFGEIFKQCDALQSQHVLAWTWVISPAPDLMELVPESQRRDLMHDLTDRVVEDYYTERGLDVPEYSFVMHCARTKAKDGQPSRDHLHTHVILPGTAPSTADRLPVYNNATRGHDRLFREIATRHFADALDVRIGPEWRRLREEPARDEPIDRDSDVPR